MSQLSLSLNSSLLVRDDQGPRGAPTGADVAHQTSMHARGSIEFQRNRLLRIAGQEPPSFTHDQLFGVVFTFKSYTKMGSVDGSGWVNSGIL